MKNSKVKLSKFFEYHICFIFELESVKIHFYYNNPQNFFRKSYTEANNWRPKYVLYKKVNYNFIGI